MNRFAAAVAALVLASTAVAAEPAVAPAPTAAEAFAKLKELAGTWKAESPNIPDAAFTIDWRVTAGGSAVMETLFQGSPHEMVSVYFIEGDELVLTHYCAAGNQPRMKYDPKKSSASELAFEFDGGTGFNPKKDFHIHEGRVTFGADGVSESWTGFADGKAADVKRMKLVSKS